MTNHIYGFVQPREQAESSQLLLSLSEIDSQTMLGFFIENLSDLYGFPEAIKQDAKDTNSVVFYIGDNKERKEATYLIDGLDYAPEARITLPKKSNDRIELLVSFILRIAHVETVKRVFVAMTENNEIDSVIKVNWENFHNLLLGDCKVAGPPNILYIIGK